MFSGGGRVFFGNKKKKRGLMLNKPRDGQEK